MTRTTGATNHLTVTMTSWAGLLHREKALLHAHLALAITGATGLAAGTRFSARTITGFTLNLRRYTNFFCGATHGLLKVQIHGVTQVRTTLHTGSATTSSATKNVAKHITKYITKTCASATSCIRINTRMTILIIGAFLLVVWKYLVSFVHFFKTRFCSLIARITIRVILHRHAAKSFFNFFFIGAFGHAKNFVKIAFRHSYSTELLMYFYH